MHNQHLTVLAKNYVVSLHGLFCIGFSSPFTITMHQVALAFFTALRVPSSPTL